jgi:fatty-acyl-CoA synthase
MHTQEMDRTIKRACRNTIGDAIRRSTGRNSEKDALIFGEQRWSYAGLDAGANRVANELLARGLEKGDRVAAYGVNSDAYVLLWLGCVRAGLVHVPVNFHLTGDELLYILNQSGSKALFYDPQFQANVEEVRDEAGATIYGILRDRDDFDVVSVARSGDDPSEPEADLDEEDVAQILYTSGTTSAPKGAVLTHRALLAEYVSCIEALEYGHDDRALHSLPLYHSAQMHVFLMPDLLVGATNFVVVAPDPAQCCGLIEREKINSMFAPRRSGSPFCGTRPSRSATSPASRRCSTAPRSCPCSGSCAKGCPTPGSTTATGRARSHPWPPSCGPRSSTRIGWPPSGVPPCSSRQTKTAERNGERDTDRREPAVG